METFVVRVFVPATPEPCPLCGLVERVGSIEPTPFRNGEELIAALRLTPTAAGPARTTDEKEEA